jgi:hypothetical protein
MALRPEDDLGNLPKISEIEVSDGLAGNLQTIDVMKKVAQNRSGHPLIRKLALNIIQGIPSNHFADESLAIGDYVKNKVRYARDPLLIEYLQDPVDLVKQIQSGGVAQGDCDDMALFIATLLLAVGHEPYFRAVRYTDPVGNYNHIYVVDYDRNGHDGPRERIVLDAIIKDQPIGTELNHSNGQEYAVA